MGSRPEINGHVLPPVPISDVHCTERKRLLLGDELPNGGFLFKGKSAATTKSSCSFPFSKFCPSQPSFKNVCNFRLHFLNIWYLISLSNEYICLEQHPVRKVWAKSKRATLTMENGMSLPPPPSSPFYTSVVGYLLYTV